MLNKWGNLPRRSFLQVAGYGAVGVLSKAATAPVTASAVDVELMLRATLLEVPLWPGPATRVWGYQGEVLAGDPLSLQPLQAPARGYPVRYPNLLSQAPPRRGSAPYSYLGPIIRLRRGQRVRIHFTNLLPEATVMHWHGLHVPPEADAHPSLLVAPGQSYVYEFDVLNRAGTYWFHPHPDGRTARQVYHGLAGLFIVTDEEEAAVGLPAGSAEVPLVLQDRLIDADNQFVYSVNTGMEGFLGDRILVNGRPDFMLAVTRRAYRLRLLNGSNSRVYKLAWSDGAPLQVIGTDGGLLERPVEREYVMLVPGERVELWADFSSREVNEELQLRSLPFSGVNAGMGGAQALPNGAAFTVLKVRVTGGARESGVLPARLSTINRYRLEDAVNRAAPRSFAVTFGMMSGGMRWLLNGRPYNQDEVAANEVVQLNTTEVWELVNNSTGGPTGGMMGMSMVHPLHIHGLQFQVLERQGGIAGYETVRYGYVDEGWKDTVMLMPGERIRLLMRFEDFTGKYVYHCHNLEHEDAGMMRNYLVRG
ncbi:MAG: multicopper oxidase domain-containing protein [Acidobacteria bacterium]|nr:multicopper oxidase domain-containing protein [Acidobacteriota bacterium]MBI3425605.1 multicopper oxidase domain-containing protein [Acidobacteriota bacterium]